MTRLYQGDVAADLEVWEWISRLPRCELCGGNAMLIVNDDGPKRLFNLHCARCHHQTAIGEVPLGQRGFYIRLPFQQPIHGSVQVVVADTLQFQTLSQAATQRVGV